MEYLLHEFAVGTLTDEYVFNDQGHGALVYHPDPLQFPEGDFGAVVTGPRRNMMRGSHLRPYFAAPFGDMMLVGCFGLLAAVADLLPELSQPLHDALYYTGENGTPPWEVHI